MCSSSGELGGDVGEDEELRVLRMSGELVDAFVGEFDAAVFLVDDEVERVSDDRHFALVVLKVIALCFEKHVLHTFLAEEADEGAVLGQTFICAEEKEGAFLADGFVL